MTKIIEICWILAILYLNDFELNLNFLRNQYLRKQYRKNFQLNVRQKHLTINAQ